MKARPEILGVRTVARSRIFHVEAVQLRFENGTECEFERIAATAVVGTVIVVAVPTPGKVLLVREYAVGLHRYELGLPMGLIEAGESVTEAADRELREETGFSARVLVPLTTMSLAPGILSYQARIVLATDLVACHAQGDEPETPELVTASMADLTKWIATEELTEARTLAALFTAAEYIRTGNRS
jgi:ADP-ribose diphosphatase